MCNHPLIDKGVCYYCGLVCGKLQQSLSADEVVAVFKLDDLESLQLAIDCLVGVYSRMSDEERAFVRDRYSKPIEILRPVVDQLKEIKRSKRVNG